MHILLKLARFLKPYRFYLAGALLAALAEIAADLFQPWPLKFVIDNILKKHPLPAGLERYVGPIFGTSDIGILYFALFSILAIACLGAVASFAQDYLMPRIGHWVMHDLRRQLYWHIQGLSLSYHNEQRLGDLMGTLTGDIHAARELIESALLGLLINSLALGGMIFIVFSMDWRFALIALSIAPALFVLVFRYTRRVKQLSRDVRRREGKVASIAQEVLSSIRVVQAFTREYYEQARFERESLERISAGIEVRTLQAKLKSLVGLVVAAGTVLVLWHGVRQVLLGHLMPGTLLVLLAYLSRLYRPMRDLSKQSEILNRAQAGLERVFGLLETERTVQDLPGARIAPPLKGKIEFDHVAYAYCPGKPVLDDVCFRAEPGQVLGIVGSTGAGKTTLLSLIPRFHDPDRGSIRIDGRDIRSYTLASLRSQISLVLQETVLFYGTVRENIAYGRPETSPDEIVAAAAAANAQEFIEKLPDGYETLIGERGVTLSGGQRQRLAIARAMIRNAPIILLDEPTTGLDATSEALVMEGLARLIAGRTAIIIAHRLSTVSRCDAILVLEGGRIVETGTHQQLLGARGRYAELYEVQFRGQAATFGAESPVRTV
jgi:ATP-binding cassette, subfamily B, bacterial